MTGFTDISATMALDQLIDNYPYIGLLTVVGIDAGTGFTEVSGASYQRISTGSGDWGVVTGSAPSTISNVSAFSFPEATTDWGTLLGFGFFDAPTLGNVGSWDYIGGYTWEPCTISNGSPGVFTTRPHGYSVGNNIIYNVEYGGASPTFSQSNFTGVLAIANAATNTFDVTNATVQVNTSSTGSGMVRRIVRPSIVAGLTLTFPIGYLTLKVA